VEGHWPEGWQARQGKPKTQPRLVCSFGADSATYRLVNSMPRSISLNSSAGFRRADERGLLAWRKASNLPGQANARLSGDHLGETPPHVVWLAPKLVVRRSLVVFWAFHKAGTRLNVQFPDFCYYAAGWKLWDISTSSLGRKWLFFFYLFFFVEGF
jgi:hypothetical protein